MDKANVQIPRAMFETFFGQQLTTSKISWLWWATTGRTIVHANALWFTKLYNMWQCSQVADLRHTNEQNRTQTLARHGVTWWTCTQNLLKRARRMLYNSNKRWLARQFELHLRCMHVAKTYMQCYAVLYSFTKRTRDTTNICWPLEVRLNAVWLCL